MSKPDYQRPFDAEDFRGYFTWTSDLSDQLGPHLYHACHRDELDQVLHEGRLGLRSDWSLCHPLYGLWEAPGVWCGLNHFAHGNNYGPILLSFPIEVLDGRTFMVFRRESKERNRYFFVQYESGIPIFSRGEKLWRRVKPTAYFSKDRKGRLRQMTGAIYDLVLTAPLRIRDVVIEGVEHQRCIPGKCGGVSRSKSRGWVRKFATAALRDHLKRTQSYETLLRRFPELAGLEITLPQVDES